MVTVCFTPQQKDTKQKKNKRTEEIYRFYLQRDVKNRIPWGNPTYLLGKIYLAWLNILPCNPAIFVSGSFSESRTANSRKSKQSENICKKKFSLEGKISDRTFNWNRSIYSFVDTNFN